MDLLNVAERALNGIGDTGKGDTLVQLRNLRTYFSSLDVGRGERGKQVLNRIDQQICILDPPKARIRFKPKFPFVGR